MSEATDRRSPDCLEPSDDVEILEVVGMDEDSPPAAAGEEVEIVFEPAPAPPATSAEEEETAREVDALKERLLRLRADFENFKKRASREQRESEQRAAGRLIATVLPVVDDLERALAAARSEAGGEGLRAGVEMIHRQLLEALSREGVRPVDAVGCRFDPNVHDAVATDDSAAQPPQTVVEELRRGYWLHDRLLRPALVTVSVAPGGAPDASPAGEEG